VIFDLDRFTCFCQATTYGNACLEQNYTLPVVLGINYTVLAGFSTQANASEDCMGLFVDL
jgi:hypothetical protein